MGNLIWQKCVNGDYCNFWSVNLDHSHFDNLEGIYLIWIGNKMLYVGQGVIKDRIAAHRTESDFTKYWGQDVRVTWCGLDNAYRDGVERYLANHYTPEIGLTHPDVNPISVNLPE